MISLLQPTSKLTAMCQPNPFTKTKLLEIVKNYIYKMYNCVITVWITRQTCIYKSLVSFVAILQH